MQDDWKFLNLDMILIRVKCEYCSNYKFLFFYFFFYHNGSISGDLLTFEIKSHIYATLRFLSSYILVLFIS